MLILGLENVMREGVDSKEQITVPVTARIGKRTDRENRQQCANTRPITHRIGKRTDRGNRQQCTNNRPSYC